jgi:hypothetical protein
MWSDQTSLFLVAQGVIQLIEGFIPVQTGHLAVQNSQPRRLD